MISSSAFVRSSRILVPAVLLALAVRPAAAEIRYTVTDLGTITGSYGAVTDINDSGQVTLISGSHNYLYNGGLPLIDLGSSGSASHSGINNSGQVAIQNGATYRATLYSGGIFRDLGSLGGSSWGNGINNLGAVVGSSYTTGAEHAFVYSGNGPMQDIGSVSGNSVALAINDLGRIVGYDLASPGSMTRKGFLYTPGVGMIQLPTLGGAYNVAHDINNSNQIVGVSTNTSGQYRPFAILNGTTLVDLGTLGGASGGAGGINDLGQIVGGAKTAAGIDHAFLYDTAMIDLNNYINPASGWTLNGASEINNVGQIVGTGTYGGTTHGFILTPIPEPASLTLLALGAAALMLPRRQRKS